MSKSSHPSRDDLEQILSCAALLADVSGVSDFYKHATSAFSELLPEVDPSCELIEFSTKKFLDGHTAVAIPPHLYKRFQELLPQHPMMVAWHKANGDGEFWSDPHDPRAIRMFDSKMYQEIYRHIGVEHQFLISIPIDDARRLTAMFSSRHPFSSRQRNLIAMIRPHLWAAFASWERINRARDVNALNAPELAKSFGLSPKRSEVLSQLITGKSNAQIAASMQLSVGTVRKHVELLLRDLNVSSRHAAVQLVFQNRA